MIKIAVVASKGRNDLSGDASLPFSPIGEFLDILLKRAAFLPGSLEVSAGDQYQGAVTSPERCWETE